MNEDKELMDSLTDEEKQALAEMQEADTATAPVEPVEEAPAEEPAPVAEEAPDEGAESEAHEDGKPQKGHVPHAAMHKEREGRKAAERQRDELLARIEALEASQPKPEPVKVEPAPVADEVPDAILEPEKFNEWLKGQFQKQDGNFEQLQREAEERRILATFTEQTQRARAAKPDYDTAVTQAMQNRVAEIRAMSPGATEDQISQHVNGEVRALVQQAIAQGQDATEMLYNVALARGYRPAESAAPADASRMQALKKAEQNTQGLASSSPSAGVGALTIEALAKMSEPELAKVQKERPAEFARAMGA